MRNRFLHLALLLSVLAVGAGGTAGTGSGDSLAPSRVFVLAGDENMLGRGQPLTAGEPSDSRLFVLRNGAWEVAADPLGKPSSSKNGVGLGMTFGLRVLADEPSATVGLVMCAAAESRMRDWQSGKLLKTCIATARAASDHVDGVLFLQGRADARRQSDAQAWEKRFAAMLSGFRAQLGVAMPYVVGQLGAVGSRYSYAGLVRDEQTAAANDYPGVSLVPTLDLPVGPDGYTFTVDGYKTLGARFESAWHAASAVWHPPDEVFVLAGQSNMVGRGKPISAGTLESSPSLLNLRDGVWAFASDPLGPLSKKDSGVGPGMTFGLRVLQHRPDTSIGLVLCAVGGTSISDWQPGGSLYRTCVSEAQATGARIGGILFLQGEADSDTQDAASAWEGKFDQMLAAFRSDLGSDVPFVLGQIGAIENGGNQDYRYAPVVRAGQADAAATNPGVALATTDDLPLADDVHFTVDAYKTIGERFGDGWWSLAGP